MTTTALADQVRDYLDCLAAITAVHGLVLDADVSGHMGLSPIPVRDVSYGGYCARVRQEADGVTCWWEIGIAEAGVKSSLWPVESIDITKLSAHQRLELQAALARVTEILRG